MLRARLLIALICLLTCLPGAAQERRSGIGPGRPGDAAPAQTPGAELRGETSEGKGETSKDEGKDEAEPTPGGKAEEQSKGRKGLNLAGLVLAVLTGLALFLYGLTQLEEGLKAVAGDRLREILAKFTRNRFAGVATGTVVTTIVDSSSLTTITVVGLVSAGVLAFSNSLGVIMGANIGTTISSQIIAMKFTDYFGFLLVVGLLLRFFGRSETLKSWGVAVMGLGLVFFGLEYMGGAVEPVKDEPWFTATMARMENPLFGILVGAGLTALIQSSSAMMGIVITLASQGAVSLPAGIALMMGAELGTTADTLMATVGRARPAVRAGVFQLLFNAGNVLLLVWFTEQLARVATWITPGTGAAAISRQIANAHVLFNVLGVLVFIWFTPQMATLLERMIPDREPAGEQEPRSEQGRARPRPSRRLRVSGRRVTGT